MKAGLIINPGAARGNRPGLALASRLEPTGQVEVGILERFEALPEMLASMGRAGVTDLFISSGDGTVQAIQTELAERNPFPVVPRLYLLPHGSTNMTAADVGLRAKSMDQQAALMFDPQPAIVEWRPSLRIVNASDGVVRHGMFMGAGAISAASRYCQEAFHARGRTGNWPLIYTLGGSVLRSILGISSKSGQDRIDRPYPMAVSADGETLGSGAQLLMLLTTLDKLVLGTRPFREGGEGAIRCTILPYPTPMLLRWTLPILYGSPKSAPPPGMVSQRGATFSIQAEGGYLLDGQFFEGPAEGPLVVETGPKFAFVRG